MQKQSSYQVHLNTICNGVLSDPLCDSVHRGLTLVRLGVPTGFVKKTILPLYVSIIFLIFRMLWLSYIEEMFGMMLKLSMLLQLLVFLKSQRLVTLLKIDNNFVNSYYGSVIFSFLFLSLWNTSSCL